MRTLITLLTLTLSLLTVSAGTLSLEAFELKDFTVVAGTVNIQGLDIFSDTTTSSEDVLFAIIPISLSVSNGGHDWDVMNVRLYNGDIPVTTSRGVVQLGINIFAVNISQAKGTVSKGLTLRFDLAVGAIGSYQWSIPTNGWAVIGKDSGDMIAPTFINNSGPVITAVKEVLPGRILSITPKPGSLEMTVGSITPGYLYWVQRSFDLQNWSDILPLYSSGDITVDLGRLGDYEASGKNWFFRLRTQ